jgi:hypothetical protein
MWAIMVLNTKKGSTMNVYPYAKENNKKESQCFRFLPTRTRLLLGSSGVCYAARRFLSLSLSLSLYIYIYFFCHVHILFCHTCNNDHDYFLLRRLWTGIERTRERKQQQQQQQQQ